MTKTMNDIYRVETNAFGYSHFYREIGNHAVLIFKINLLIVF
jgi:hypothetical protein